MMEEKKSHGFSVIERKSVVMTGIVSIDGFDEENIIMKTDDDGISLQGHGLHVDKFDADTGELYCSGTVDAIVYYDAKRRMGRHRRRE